jgi:hypothetical protein
MLTGIVHGLLGAAAIVGSIVTWELGRKAIMPPPAPVVVTKPVEPATVKPEPSSADRLVAAAKARPTIVDEFEAATKQVIVDARAKLAKK